MGNDMKACLWCGEPLPRRRRKYCCDEHAHLYFIHCIKPFWWSCAREAALLRAEYKCENCGSIERLEVHHKISLERREARHNSSKNELGNLRVLCRNCHEDAHRKCIGREEKYREIAAKRCRQMVMELKI